jgi:hypothetical protein
MRSASVLLFIAATAAIALFCAQQRTVARGDMLAAELMESNKLIKSMDCDKKVPIGIDGATFGCKIEFKNGDRADYKFKLDREGSIIATDHGDTERTPRQPNAGGDPWSE